MTGLTIPSAGVACPTPSMERERILLGHGSGGKLSAALLRDHILPHFTSPALRELGDAAVVPVTGSQIVVSTDAFVVNPLEFPGGDIGVLAVHGVQQAAMALEVAYRHDADDADIDVLVQNVARLLEPVIAGLQPLGTDSASLAL